MPLIEGVVFDLDGVLTPDSELANISAGKKTFEDLGTPLTSEEAEFIVGKSSRTYCPVFLRTRDIAPERDEEIIAINKCNYNELWPRHADLPPELSRLLLHLVSANKALAIATSNRRRVINQLFASKRFIENLFGAIVTGEDVEHHKPHPEVYQVAAKRLGIHPSNLLAVEDMAIGVASAKDAGLWCAAIPSPLSYGQDFSRADYKIQSLYELIEITGGYR